MCIYIYNFFLFFLQRLQHSTNLMAFILELRTVLVNILKMLHDLSPGLDITIFMLTNIIHDIKFSTILP